MKVYFTLNLIGSLLWMVGFFMAASTVYPYCLIGIFLGPLVLLAGIVNWAQDRKRNTGIYPNPFTSFHKELSRHSGFLRYHNAYHKFAQTHTPHLLVFMIVFWITLAIVGRALVKNSQTFQLTQAHVEADPKLAELIGEVQYYGVLIGGTFSSVGDAEFFFAIIGEQGTVDAKATVNNWKVEQVEYR